MNTINFILAQTPFPQEPPVWEEEEILELIDFVKLYGKQWTLISLLKSSFRTAQECQNIWEFVL